MSTKHNLARQIRLFLAGAFFLILSKAAAGPSCAVLFDTPTLTESQARLQRQWDLLDEMKSRKDRKLKRQAMRVMNEIKAVWAEQGIAFETDPENPYNIFAAVPKTSQELRRAHPINRMAASMQSSFAIRRNGRKMGKGLRIVVNPLELKREEAGALFDEQASSLTLARDNATQGLIDDMVAHEARHAYGFYEFASGNDHDFTVWISNSETGPVFHDTYPHEFSADELPAYVKQLSVILHAAIRKNQSLDDARAFTEIALRLANAAARPQVLDVSRLLASDLRRNRSHWSTPLRAKELINGEEIDVVKMSSAKFKSRVYFYESPLIEAQADEVPFKVTHVVFENGEDRVDAMTLVPLDPSNLDPLLSKIERKLAGLQTRTDGMLRHLREAEEGLSRNDGPTALRGVRGALRFISIKEKKNRR